VQEKKDDLLPLKEPLAVTDEVTDINDDDKDIVVAPLNLTN